MKKIIITIVIVLVLGGGYLVSKGSFCFIKINGDCKFGRDTSGITNIIRVPVNPGDTQEDIVARFEAGFPKSSNEFITAKFFGSNQDFNISGKVLSKDWVTDFESKDHSAGFVEIYDANGKLVIRDGLKESGGPAENGRFVVPFKYYTFFKFSKPSTKEGKIILYDVNKNTNGLTKPLEIPIKFY